jgi:hypothetical protein
VLVQAALVLAQAVQALVQAVQALAQAVQALAQAVQALVQAVQALAQVAQALAQAVQALRIPHPRFPLFLARQSHQALSHELVGSPAACLRSRIQKPHRSRTRARESPRQSAPAEFSAPPVPGFQIGERFRCRSRPQALGHRRSAAIEGRDCHQLCVGAVLRRHRSQHYFADLQSHYCPWPHLQFDPPRAHLNRLAY